MYKVTAYDEDDVVHSKEDQYCAHQRPTRHLSLTERLAHKEIQQFAESIALKEWYGLDIRASEKKSVPQSVASVRRKRLAIFYGTFTAVAIGLLSFASLELLFVSTNESAMLSTPASLLLLFGSIGLILEFYMGFKADLAAPR